MQFEVRALQGNAVTSVFIDALSVEDARAQALARSLQPIAVRATRRRWARDAGGHRLDLSLLLFSQELLALLEGGLTIVESIDVLAEKETRTGVRSLYARIARVAQTGTGSAVDNLP